MRREKSIACQTTKPVKHPKKHLKIKSSNLQIANSVNDEHTIMKKKLLASLNITSSNHIEQENNSNHQLISTTSSTTSGVELSSKNSTNGPNSIHYDGSSENIHRFDTRSINKVDFLFLFIMLFFEKTEYLFLILF